MEPATPNSTSRPIRPLRYRPANRRLGTSRGIGPDSSRSFMPDTFATEARSAAVSAILVLVEAVLDFMRPEIFERLRIRHLRGIVSQVVFGLLLRRAANHLGLGVDVDMAAVAGGASCTVRTMSGACAAAPTE